MFGRQSSIFSLILLLSYLVYSPVRAASEPRKNYAGETLPDNEIAMIVLGWENAGTAPLLQANVASIDGVDCPPNVGRGGGDPYCGLFVQMAPGEHTLKVRITTDHHASVLGLAWKEQYVDGVQAVLEKGVVYKLVPAPRSDGTFSVSVEEICRGKAHNAIRIHWALHSKEMLHGVECP